MAGYKVKCHFEVPNAAAKGCNMQMILSGDLHFANESTTYCYLAISGPLGMLGNARILAGSFLSAVRHVPCKEEFNPCGDARVKNKT
jgi:hypothetical protein